MRLKRYLQNMSLIKQYILKFVLVMLLPLLMVEIIFYTTHLRTVENDTVTVECSPVSRAVFESHLIWSDDRCKMGDGMTKIVYPRSDYGDGERFVRVHLTDAQGNQAWSNIIHF